MSGWPFFAASWVIAVSPGSGAVLSMSHGLAYGVRNASATIAGLQLGLSVMLLVAGVGVGALLLASATAFTVVKVLGAAYLIWLGVQQWRAPVPAAAASQHEASGPVGLPTVRQRICPGLLHQCHQPQGHRVHGGGAAPVHRPQPSALAATADPAGDLHWRRSGGHARLCLSGLARPALAGHGPRAAGPEPRVRRRADGHGGQPVHGQATTA
jgi:hypothetical protein